jgi:hypothetical protein
VYAVLAGPKTLKIVEKGGHNGLLSMVWTDAERWLDEVVAR